ncbi:MAG: MiaB/RimO family radical SAM methylthiotransferase, partial [Proteobacteria bacterium]|nr:MiaB/RimO family radical SAM methylthiotransferase [Pseudomonadota bacterium]
ILEEARRLVESGSKEIILLGQNVNAWHGEGLDGKTWSLGRLIMEMAGLDVFRLRYTTSHPRDMNDELIEAHRSVPQLAPFLHLPLQSASDRILKAMNRGHTAEDYLRLIDRVRAARHDMAFSSDFLVGFPGESDQDFEDTLAMVRKVGYAQAYSFKYSPRPGTPAAIMATQVPEDVKTARLQALQSLIFEQQRKFNQNSIGQTLEVLFDRKGRKEGQLHGRSLYMQSVHATGPAESFGQIAQVKIGGATASSLEGEVCTSS